MVIKSLTITEEAYNALKMIRRGDESFSKIIIRISEEKRGSIAEYFGALKDSKEKLNEIKKRIKSRRNEITSEFSERAKRIGDRIS